MPGENHTEHGAVRYTRYNKASNTRNIQPQRYVVRERKDEKIHMVTKRAGAR